MRLKLFPYLVLWLGLVALQIAVGWAVVQPVPLLGNQLAIALVVLLQLVKLPVAVGRLNDLGRAPDDAMLAMVPLVSLGLAMQLFTGSPTDAEREAQRATWSGELQAVAAFGKGISVVARALPVFLLIGIPIAGIYTAAFEGATQSLDWAITAPADKVEPYLELLQGVTLFLGAYTLFQVAKSNKASRVSWLPALLFVPSLILTAAFMARNAQGLGPVLMSLPADAVALAWESTFGAALAVAWMTVAEQMRVGQWPGVGKGLGDAISAMSERGPDVATPHGAAAHAVQIGMHLLIPGVYYSLVWAFVDMTALFEPDRNALARSTELTLGIRRRIFKVIALGFVAEAALTLATGLAVYDAGTVFAAQFDPPAVSWKMWLLWNTLTMLVAAVTKVAFFYMYRDRLTVEAREVAAGVRAASVEAPASEDRSALGLGILIAGIALSGLSLWAGDGRGVVFTGLILTGIVMIARSAGASRK